MIENGQPDGSYVLMHGGKRIPFHVEYRKRKKLAITVHPDLRLEVVAPAGKMSEQVLSRVEKRAGWILRQWRYFEKFLPRPPGPFYVSGETHLYLGRQYRLKVHEGSLETVKLMGRFLHAWTGDRTKADRVKTLLERWYREHAERVFEHRLKLCLEQCPALKLDHEPRLAIRMMTHRWGSCTKAGNVLINLDLIKVPIHCVDYVLVHELCHLQIHNHSPAFYRLLSRSMPDWERRKERLEGFVT
jgi:predicted metal-dependent hydrolase